MNQFSAEWICPVSTRPLRGGTVVVDGDRIESIVDQPVPGLPIERFEGCAIIPGFVNAHTHLELTVLRGFLEGLSFIDWIRTLTRTKYEQMNEEDLLFSARLGVVECLAAGVTTVGEVMDAGTGWQAMCEFGLRGVAYQEIFGPDPDDAPERVRMLEARLSTLASEGVTSTRHLGVSPHAPYSVSEPLYRAVGVLSSRNNLPVAVHLAESREEGVFVREGTGPFADHLIGRGIPVRARGTSPIEYVDGLGVLGARTLAIHAIDASETDIARLRDRGVALAHCPKSNHKLGHAVAPLCEFMGAGLRIGLGTDSVASNNVVDMFEEMRSAVFAQRARLADPTALRAAELLEMATLGGAQCLDMASQVGTLERGKLADFVVVDLSDPALQPVYDPVEAMVFSATRQNIRHTFQGGRRVVIDSGPYVAEAGRIGERLQAHRGRTGGFQTPLSK